MIPLDRLVLLVDLNYALRGYRHIPNHLNHHFQRELVGATRGLLEENWQHPYRLQRRRQPGLRRPNDSDWSPGVHRLRREPREIPEATACKESQDDNVVGSYIHETAAYWHRLSSELNSESRTS
jgi:hypothetical protein